MNEFLHPTRRQLPRAVAHGFVKVNIGTAFSVAFTSAVRQHLAENPGPSNRVSI